MTAPARDCPACHTPLPMEAQFCLQCGTATPTEPGVPSRTMATGAAEVAKVRRALGDTYKIERVLGEGGMATVYLAEDVKHRRKVAVKVMRPELAATLGADRFLREIEIAAQLSHPHILPVHDSGETDGLLFYVMPYVEGESLRERVHRDGQLPVDEALALTREVAEALGYAHRRGIIHRDIKPANILLGEGHALVADFGIARATDGGQALTQTGLAVGTPQYMSPEQATGERDIDARSDVYAIGAVLYEMLAGQPPFAGPTPQAVLAKSLTEEVQPLATVRPGVPAAVASVVAKAMARRPADRYASAVDLEQAIAAARDAVRSGPVAHAPKRGASPATAWGAFAVAAAVSLAVIYGLVSRWGLASWTLGLAVGLLGVGAAVLLTTTHFERLRQRDGDTKGLGRWFTWANAARGAGLAAALWVTVALVLVFRGPGFGAASADGAVRLAVMPFDNRGDPADAYVVDGIADQVRGKLTGLGAFQVTARTSSDQFRGSTESPQQIGRALGVDYLLTATVSWAKDGQGGGRVQVVPELIDARTGAVSWQQSFDAAITDVFQVQSDMAVRVAGALNVALGSGEQRDIAAPPTKNLAAYDAYLKAQEAGRTTGRRAAISLYEQAVALDSTFSEAWARLSLAQSEAYFANPTPEAADGALRAAERARALAPEAPESYSAMGTYYANVLFDFVRAREQFEAGLRRAPSHIGLLIGNAFTDRSLGRWDEAVALLRRAQALDPRSVGVQFTLASNHLWLRQYGEALAALDAAMTLAPNAMGLVHGRAMVYAARGDLAGARTALRNAPSAIEPTRLVAYVAATWDTFWLLDDEQQGLLLRLTPGTFDDDRGAWGTSLASIYRLRGDSDRSRAYGDSAAMWYDEKLRATPDDNYLLALSGVAHALAGRRAEAIANAERAVELLPVTKDAFSGAYNQHLLARTYTILGDQERAIDNLEALLRVPYFLSPGWLRIDPTFGTLKGNPRFERLIAG